MKIYAVRIEEYHSNRECLPLSHIISYHQTKNGALKIISWLTKSLKALAAEKKKNGATKKSVEMTHNILIRYSVYPKIYVPNSAGVVEIEVKD